MEEEYQGTQYHPCEPTSGALAQVAVFVQCGVQDFERRYDTIRKSAELDKGVTAHWGEAQAASGV